MIVVEDSARSFRLVADKKESDKPAIPTRQTLGTATTEFDREPVGEVCFVSTADGCFVVATSEDNELLGIGSVELCGGFNESIEVVSALVFGSDGVFRRSLVPFSLHCTKEIAVVNDEGVAFFGLVKVFLFELPIATGVVMVNIASQKYPLFPLCSNVWEPDDGAIRPKVFYLMHL